MNIGSLVGSLCAGEIVYWRGQHTVINVFQNTTEELNSRSNGQLHDINALKQRKRDRQNYFRIQRVFEFVFSPVSILSRGRDSTPRNLHPPPLTECLSQLTALTKSIISTRGRAISQQGHQDAAAEVALFIYLFIYLSIYFPGPIVSFIK